MNTPLHRLLILALGLTLFSQTNAQCTTNIPDGGTANDAYTSSCAETDVADGASCTLTCSAAGYTGTSTVLCTAGTFAATETPFCSEAATCTTNIPDGGTANDAYTSSCAETDVADGASCTLTCSAAGYTGTSTVLCTAGTFATTESPTCVSKNL